MGESFSIVRTQDRSRKFRGFFFFFASCTLSVVFRKSLVILEMLSNNVTIHKKNQISK